MIRVIDNLKQSINSSPMPAALVYGPCLFFVVWTLMEFFLPTKFIMGAVSENGIIEWAHVGFSFSAFLTAFYLFIKVSYVRNRLLKIWLFFFFVGCLYITGEEISWGQWIFHWETPDSIGQYNDQNETNLHNTSHWLDQKPRALIEIGIILSGLILPLLHRKSIVKLPEWLLSLLPPFNAIYLTGIYLLVKLSDVCGDMVGFHVYLRGSEVIELIIYYYLFVYILSLSSYKNKA